MDQLDHMLAAIVAAVDDAADFASYRLAHERGDASDAYAAGLETRVDRLRRVAAVLREIRDEQTVAVTEEETRAEAERIARGGERKKPWLR